MNITLIGMAGVGKSYIGKKSAERLGYSFIDIDEVMEEQTGEKIQSMVSRLGDEKFLELEERIILELGIITDHVISPGGSIVYCDDAMNYLKKISVVVYLKDKFENIQERILQRDNRGIVGSKDKKISEIYDEREELYEKYANITIDISTNNDPEHIVETIIANIKGENHSKCEE